MSWNWDQHSQTRAEQAVQGNGSFKAGAAGDTGMLAVVGKCLVGLGVVAMAMNAVLILMSLGIPRRRVEVDLAIVLALVDMALASNMAVGTYQMLKHGFDAQRVHAICRYKGPVDFAGLYVSMMLVALIGVIRHARVFGVRIGYKFWAGLSLASVLYTALVAWCVVHDEFGVSPSKIDCAPDPKQSAWSRVLILFNGVALLGFLLLTLACYLRIMFAVAQTPPREGFVEVKGSSLEGEQPPSLVARARIAGRPLAISVTYFILIAPACLLIVLEALTFGGDCLQHTSLAISVCLANISLANPILILFAHTTIYNSAKHKCTVFVQNFTKGHRLAFH